MAEETKDIMRDFISKQESLGDTGQDCPSSGKPEPSDTDTPGSVTDGAKTISEKYGFLKRVKEAVAKKPEGVASESVTQEMLELMETGAWLDNAKLAVTVRFWSMLTVVLAAFGSATPEPVHELK